MLRMDRCTGASFVERSMRSDYVIVARVGAQNGSLSLFVPAGAISDVAKLSQDVRLVDELRSFMETICVENGFDHLRAMTMTRKPTSHLHHLRDALAPSIACPRTPARKRSQMRGGSNYAVEGRC